MILQTKITNKTAEDKKFVWLGTAGMYVPAGESIIVEGAYPTACINPMMASQMQVEIEMGLVEVGLVTDMNVEAPGQTKTVKTRKRKAAPRKKKEMKVETLQQDTKSENANKLDKDRFAQGPMEAFIAEAKSLDNDEGVPPSPETVEIFTDARNPDGVSTKKKKGKKEQVFQQV